MTLDSSSYFLGHITLRSGIIPAPAVVREQTFRSLTQSQMGLVPTVYRAAELDAVVFVDSSQVTCMLHLVVELGVLLLLLSAELIFRDL